MTNNGIPVSNIGVVNCKEDYLKTRKLERIIAGTPIPAHLREFEPESAELDNKTGSYGYLNFYQVLHYESKAKLPIFSFCGVGVEPDHREKGVFSAMFAELLRVTFERTQRDKLVYIVEIDVQNRPMIAAIESKGFKKRGCADYFQEFVLEISRQEIAKYL